jgi:2-polyprenyl-6-hydroxyphenyl methylase / 3-demethylubiquinone-9 3-methyltransferase
MMTGPTDAPTSQAKPNVDPDEVERFRRMADQWWDASGKFKPLHKIGPPRLTFIRDELVKHYRLESGGLKPLKGLSILDIGCGGGLVSEPLSRMGATVTGIDPGDRNIAVAKLHAEPQGLAIEYRTAMAEDLAAEGRQFDAVVCLEVVEHVPDVGAFMNTCASLVKPGGAMIASTINRNMKSYALAIVAAEYILRWLPRGTHQWDRFITPDELAGFAKNAGLDQVRVAGMTLNVLRDQWGLSTDTDVNYLAAFAKPT